jgi:hypothetical protein
MRWRAIAGSKWQSVYFAGWFIARRIGAQLTCRNQRQSDY